jgi:hypothetical protein
LIEAGLLALALFGMMLLIWNIYRSSKRGARKTLGIFSYAELLEKPANPAKPGAAKKVNPHA